MSMESARACTDAAALRRFAWRDYLSRGLVDEWDRTLQEERADITCRASALARDTHQYQWSEAIRNNSCIYQSNNNKSCMPPRRRVQSSERDAMCRPPVAQTNIRSRGVRTQSTRHAHTVEAQAHAPRPLLISSVSRLSHISCKQ